MTTDPLLKSHRKPDIETTVVDVGTVRFGDGAYPVIAGPCSIESETQMMEAAAMAAEGGASMLRGGAFKPRTSPYSFQGLGEEGLWLLEHAGHDQPDPIWPVGREDRRQHRHLSSKPLSLPASPPVPRSGRGQRTSGDRECERGSQGRSSR